MTKELPFDAFLEGRVLSACLCSIEVLDESIDVLEPLSFYCGKNAVIFECCKRMFLQNKEVNPITIISELKGILTESDIAFVLSCKDYYDADYNLTEAIHKIKEKHILRKLYFTADVMIKDILNDKEDSSQIVAKYTGSLNDIVSDVKDSPLMISDIFKNYRDGLSLEKYINKCRDTGSNLSTFRGIKSYYKQLDETIGGFRNGCLHYIGARTSVGKTTFILNLINNILKNKIETEIAFFSLEMSSEIIATKLLLMRAGISFSKYENGKLNENEHDQILSAAKTLNVRLLLEDDRSKLDIEKLKSKCRRLVLTNGVKIIFIDYLTNIKCFENLNNNHERINYISQGLLDISQSLNVPVVCLAQLNRGSSIRIDKTPCLSDFRESGGIEESADICMLLHRPKYYDDSVPDDSTHVIVAKNRLLGNLRTIRYSWRKDCSGVYDEMERIETLKPL